VSRRVPVTPDSTAEVNKTPRTNDGTRVSDTCPRSPRKKLVTPKLRYMRFPHGISYDSGLMYRHTKHFLGINCARPIHPSSVRTVPQNPRNPAILQAGLNCHTPNFTIAKHAVFWPNLHCNILVYISAS
jgi:hypothetical protein